MSATIDERYYWPDGSLKWCHAVNVRHLILQLQTLDPEMAVSSVTFIDTTDGKKARAYGLSMSYERWDGNGWLDFALSGPKCLAVWATEPKIAEGINGPRTAEPCEVRTVQAPQGSDGCTGWIIGTNYRRRGRISETRGKPNGEPWYETIDGTKWSSYDVEFRPDVEGAPQGGGAEGESHD